MLCLKTFSYLHRPTSHPFKSLRCSMSITGGNVTTTTVEHVVLFRVKESTEKSKIDSMLTNLNGLTSLNIATNLTAGPVHRARSGPASRFTHLLHSRYKSKSDLANYSGHPHHVTVVTEDVKPICEEIMAVDWIADVAEPKVKPGSALRLTLAKLKPDSPAEMALETVSEAGKRVPGMVQFSCGENFSPERAEGYNLGFISVFESVTDLEALDGGGKLDEEKEKIRPMLESVIVLDYMVPAFAPASL